VRASTIRVDLGVGGVVIVSGSCTHESYSCDGWVGDLGVVVACVSCILSRMQLTQQYRGNDHFRSVFFTT
jgi:hypothetical protein